MKLPRIFRERKDRRINDDAVIEIPVYGPHDDLLPRMYCVSPYLADFEEIFESVCRRFLKETDLDRFNLGYMDAMIEERVNEAIESLDIQEARHRDVIEELRRVRMADVSKGSSRLEELERESVEVEAEIRRLERIYNAGTSLEETADNLRTIRKGDRKNEESAA